jgi:hypothetical protein
METEGSFPYAQEPATGPYPGSDESRPHLHILFKIHFNIVFPPRLGIPSDLFPSSFVNQNCLRMSHLPYTCYMPRPSHPP